MSEDKIKGITRKDFEEKLNKRYPNKDFKTALKENPKEAVTEIGLKGIPEDTVIKVVEDQKNVLYLVLPKDPMDNVTMSYIWNVINDR